jgi:hypothetical protein
MSDGLAKPERTRAFVYDRGAQPLMSAALRSHPRTLASTRGVGSQGISGTSEKGD